MYEVQEGMPRHARVIIDEPREGWSRHFFDREIAQYAKDRGSAPQTVTLHPDTMVSFGFSKSRISVTENDGLRGTVLVTSSSYARDSITLYE